MSAHDQSSLNECFDVGSYNVARRKAGGYDKPHPNNITHGSTRYLSGKILQTHVSTMELNFAFLTTLMSG